jgi:hypothetical protein
MATMHIKNKYEVSLKELIKKTKEKGGVPARIEVTPQEAWDILREIQAFGKGSPFVIGAEYQLAESIFEIKSRLFNNKSTIGREEALQLINRWVQGQYYIYIEDLQIVVKPEAINTAPKHTSRFSKWLTKFVAK